MTQKQLEQIVELVKSGHVIKVQSAYVDSFANVWQNSEGDWVFDSQILDESRLIDEKIYNISVYKPVPLDY